jgi:hypothetical protein
LVTLTNATDLLKVAAVLPASWALASGNYQFIVETTSRYAPPAALSVLLFVGVIAWELVACVLLWQAVARYRGRAFAAEPAAVRAFVVVAGLWAAFVFADELSIAYAIEATHVRFFIATLVTVLALQALPSRAGPD